MTATTKPRPAKKPHHEDVLFAEMAAKASRFTAVLHQGPGQRHRREAGSFAEAVEQGKALERENPGTRLALVYAIGARDESINVDATIARLAGFPEASIELMGKRA